MAESVTEKAHLAKGLFERFVSLWAVSEPLYGCIGDEPQHSPLGESIPLPLHRLNQESAHVADAVWRYWMVIVQRQQPPKKPSRRVPR
jgi:hypothetical protein